MESTVDQIIVLLMQDTVMVVTVRRTAGTQDSESLN